MLAHIVPPAHPPRPYKSVEPKRFAVILFSPLAAKRDESASSRHQASQHTSQRSKIRQKDSGCDIRPREHRESPREHRESQASPTTVQGSRVAHGAHTANHHCKSTENHCRSIENHCKTIVNAIKTIVKALKTIVEALETIVKPL